MKTPPIAIAAIAVFIGSAVDVLARWAGEYEAVLTIATWRFILAGVVLAVAYAVIRRRVPSWEAIRFHLMRGATQSVATIFFFFGLLRLPLASAIVLGFTAALMIAPFARLILKEPIGKVTGLATVVGFIGAGVVAAGVEGDPSKDGSITFGVICLLIAAVGYSLSVVLLRLRTKSEDAFTLIMFQNVMPALILSVVLALTVAFGPQDLGVSLFPAEAVHGHVVGIAIFGVTIWGLFTIAYGRAPAQVLAPMEYTSVVYSGILGWVLFGEVPTWHLYVGSAIIIASCLTVAVDSHFASRRAAHQPLSKLPE